MKKLIAFILSILSSPLVLAASDEFEEISDAVFLPLFDVVRPLFVKLSFVVGGIFGATLLLVIVRVYYESRTLKILKEIRFNLDQANKHKGIRYSTQKKGIIQSLLEYWQERSHSKAIKKLDKLREKKNSNKRKK